MSSLWTPGGEVPVDRNAAGEEAPPAPAGAPSEAELQAHYERLQDEMVAAPAHDVISEHAVAIYQLAALHLSQAAPRLDDARVAIDAFAALVETLGSRLGEAAEPLAGALHQLRMAFVEVSNADRATATPPGDHATE